MSTLDWTQAAMNAADEIAAEADQREFAGTTAEWLGRILVLLGRAAGHADRLSLQGTAGQQARHHFQAEVREAGACALVLLEESRRRQQQPERTSQEIVGVIARRRVVAGQQRQVQGHPAPAGHAAAGLGAALVAIGAAVPTIPLDDEHLLQLDDVLESVLGHAIAAVARA
jgi:hypothetical protein